MDPQVLQPPLVFVMSRLKMPRKWVLPFTNAAVKVVVKARQEKSRALCIHLHVLFCALELYTHVDPEPSSASATPACPTSNMSTTSVEAPSSSQQLLSNSPTASPEAPSVSRLATLNLYSTFKLPYHFSSEYLNNVSVKDASTLLGGDNGWPSVFMVKEVACEVCGEPLGTSETSFRHERG